MRVYILIAPTGLRRIPLRLQNSRFFLIISKEIGKA